MKYLAWFGGLFGILVIGVYVLAFTPLGNSILQPTIEEKIKEQTLLDSKLKVFSLSMSEFEIILEINQGNVVSLKGEYSPFSKSFDINYNVDLDNLESLKSLSTVELRKSFRTSGKVKGDMAFITVDGISDVASSDTTYHVELTEFNPTSIIAKVKKLKLSELLDIGAQKPYADADVNLDVNFKNIKPHALDGDIILATEDGKINTKVMKNDFNITIPNTDFTMNLDAKLKGDDVDYTYKLISNLFKITSSGKVIPTPLKTDIKYALDIKELALLKPVTGADVRGSFRLNGTVKGTKAKLVVDGKSDVAESDTRFEAILKEFAPASVQASMKNLKLDRVLYMVKQPHYADGIFSLDVNIPDARSGKLNGKVISSVKKGLLDVKYMTEAYKFKTPMPQTAFQMITDTTLNGDIIDSKVNLKSTLADFDIKRARVNLKNSTINSDYKATVPNLDKLYFATEQHIKGGITVNGELNKGDDFDLTILSNVAGGKIDAKLHNDDFHADILGVQTLDALYMLIYPEIFKASLDAKLDYNLASQKGKFDGHLIDGKFTKNQMLNLIKQYAKVDMYVETFKGDVHADINKEKIVASMELKSNTSSIKTKNTQLNTKTKTIDSKIDVVANKSPISVMLKGNTSSPKVTIDVEDLVKKEAGKAIEKELGKLLKGFF
ncbi:hypothetical protein SMGD1_0707 [Sulfurimonas gotlandica GD1]|uniref:Uncharacterized protein n=1 Tax=Sulfurimonas gotlandica (strain DSM 19862 / JCM 16533 / GD1) TaxID=929558 RepID=B6BNY9_SULGG|nr:hypothetical protein [Sulfurimonas gotlandica]EDZ61156.1 conserved hypothetical protein [Sulfurimonas gotlandica GD1]EHP29234.1 hypothetical protein SMGD1_0707 [Sulfurimonas gotlandica GD1]